MEKLLGGPSGKYSEKPKSSIATDPGKSKDEATNSNLGSSSRPSAPRISATALSVPPTALNSGVRVFLTGFNPKQKLQLQALLARIPVVVDESQPVSKDASPKSGPVVAAAVEATSPLEATHVLSSGKHTVATLAAALRGTPLY